MLESTTRLSLLLLANSVVRADLAVFCSHPEDKRSGWGDIEYYEFVADDFECQVAEVLCVKFIQETSTATDETTTVTDEATAGTDETSEPTAPDGETEVPTPPDEEQEKRPLFILESDPISYANGCNVSKGCLCNTNPEDWATWTGINEGVAFPDPILVPIGAYSQLKESSESDTAETLYERTIFNELLSS